MHTIPRGKLRPTLAEVKALLSEDQDFLRPVVQAVLQELLKAEMTEAVGAEKGERTPVRLGYRAGYYPRTLVTRVELVEVYEKSISTNSTKLVTFSTLSKGVEESWGEELKSGKEEAARQIGAALRMAREEVPEWGPLPFTKRKEERETKLYSQAIVLRALLRILADLHRMNEAKDRAGDWGQAARAAEAEVSAF
jgi:hypothetical protein